MNLTSTARRDGVFLIAALLAVLLYVILASVRHEIGFPLDDSWIHQVYARNLAENGEWAFVPGEPSAASTAPLYSVLLSIGHLLNLAPFFWAHLLGILALAMGAGFAARIGEQLFPEMRYVGWATGFSVLLAWHMVWAAASGMETMLFMALSLALIYFVFREIDDKYTTRPLLQGAVTGFVGGLLFLTRPEGIALVGLAGLMGLVTTGMKNPRRYMLWAGSLSLVWLMTVAPYVIFNYDLTGELLPSTADAKIAENAPARADSLPTRYANMTLPLSPGAQLMGLPGIVWGIWLVIQKIRADYKYAVFLLPLIWTLVHITLFVLRLPAPYQHGRYVMPALPPLLLYMGGGLLDLVNRYRLTMLGRVLTRSLALGTALALPSFLWIGGQAYANDVRIINTEMVATAKWVKANIPAEDIFAVHDIGALGYYAPRPMIDTAGLVTPEIVPLLLQGEKMMNFLCENNAKWLMVLPDQRFVPANDSRISLVYESPYDFASEAGGMDKKMRVYRLNCPPNTD